MSLNLNDNVIFFHWFSRENLDILYTCIFILRAWRLKTEDNQAFKKLANLTAGDITSILDEFSTMIEEMKDVLQEEFKITDIEKEDIAKIFNTKQLNSNSLEKVGKKGSVLYPNYPLMNSNCFSNTRYSIAPDLKLRGKSSKLKGRATIRHGLFRSSHQYQAYLQGRRDSN